VVGGALGEVLARKRRQVREGELQAHSVRFFCCSSSFGVYVYVYTILLMNNFHANPDRANACVITIFYQFLKNPTISFFLSECDQFVCSFSWSAV
jgi:hypothetical protein